MPLVIAPAPASGVLRYEWIDAAAVTRDLTYQTSPTVFVQAGSIGLGSAGSEIADEKLPTAPGSIVRQISSPAQRIELPITISTTSLGNLIAIQHDLRTWFRTGNEKSRTPGYLRITRPDGTVRQWQCYYAGGLEGDLSRTRVTNTTVVVSLYAPDPTPTAPSETVVTWEAADLAVPVTQINEGDLDAYPIWTVTGPATQINVQNNTTGKGWSLTYSLLAGKTVTVDTRPASQRIDLPVLDSDDVNRFPALFAGSQIFGNWLPSGLNSFTITLLGTSGATEVELRYLPRYVDGL